MAHVLPAAHLITIAHAVGIPLIESGDGNSNLYLIVDDQGNDLYIGKAASSRRHREEDGWSSMDHTKSILSGFVALWRENNARRLCIDYNAGAFVPAAALSIIEGWEGGAIDSVRARLEEGEAPTVEEVEEILVRIHIRAGRLIGNSVFASQWENPIGRFPDTMAVLAVDAARVSGLIPTLPPVSIADPANRRIDEQLREAGIHETQAGDS